MLYYNDSRAGHNDPEPQAERNLSVKENFNIYKAEYWKEGFKSNQWEVNFTGYGIAGVEKEGSNVLFQFPSVAESPNHTHASLITSSREFENISFELKVNTLKQLRTLEPNPWETAWVLWNYTDNTHFYYFILKTNGWELGKEDPRYPGAQRFLATGETPFVKLNEWNRIKVTQKKNVINVYVNNINVVSFTDNEDPYFSGKAGLYCEDSYVRYDDISITSN